jgi:hypothetical protein
MSTETWGVEAYGLYLTEDDLQQYAEKNGLETRTLLMDVGSFYNGAEGSCFLIMEDEHEAFEANEYFSILPLDRSPTLFTQAYSSKEEALHELKENYSEYLSENFDYGKKFIHYIGTVTS